ncbi:MAG: alpha/beta hydrolase [Henriciella sp.]|uniref:glucuronyl esterase domain-containing protein n=1 Tax=Henriciella sp. TaxID=1968823 RepID=UPI003C74DF19
MGIVLSILGWLGRLIILAVLVVGMSSCTMLGLNYASLEVDNKPDARPAIKASSLSQWEARRPALMKTFEDVVYGPWPEGLDVDLVDRRMVNPELAGGKGRLEELTIRVGSGEGARDFKVALATPNTGGPAPLIVSQTFGSNCGAFPGEALTTGEGESCAEAAKMPGFVTRIFGEFIILVPIEQYFDRGYAYATWKAGDMIPDRDGEAQAVMAKMAGEDSVAPTGTVAGWGYGFSAIIDVLEDDADLDMNAIAVLGHSRHGKSAMVAGVYDRRIGAVISHQSGFGGAASSRSRTGETVKRMVNGARALVFSLEGYPHWFAPAYADYASHVEDLPVDQHQYIALLAPTPIFLGNGRRDVWSDPNSTYRMAEGADPVYELYGSEGLAQDGMQDFRPATDLSYYIRPGGHSITQQDITAFMDFADAALGVPPREDVPEASNAASVSP